LSSQQPIRASADAMLDMAKSRADWAIDSRRAAAISRSARFSIGSGLTE
jgi:c-di-AMP phosphodiesterase-like protein